MQHDQELSGIYLTSAGREGVNRAVCAHAADRPEKIHVVVHDIINENVKMVKQGTVDFIIGQDVKTQGTLPIRLLLHFILCAILLLKNLRSFFPAKERTKFLADITFTAIQTVLCTISFRSR